MITDRDLENREGMGSGRGRRASAVVETNPASLPTAAEQLAELERRIASARGLKPSGKDLHCEDCFQRGRDAVLRVLGGAA